MLHRLVSVIMILSVLLGVPTSHIQAVALDQCVYSVSSGLDGAPGPLNNFYQTKKVPENKELRGVQVPIPRKDRVLNENGNCVWCSLEMLARYAEIKSLYDITKDPEDGGDPRCQDGAWWPPVKALLDEKKIKYRVVWPQDTTRTDLLIRGCKIERRGVAFDIKGHMLVLVHYDPNKKIIKVIDNADRSLSIQTWSWEKFHKVWRGWAFMIYGDPDIIPQKNNPWNKIPIERNGKLLAVPPKYLPIPIIVEDE